jgi:SAM-dependent methyltransferase
MAAPAMLRERSLRDDVSRTVEHFNAFRVEQSEPGRLYRLMAADAVADIEQVMPVDGRTLVDVGGGPGYVADEIGRAGGHCITSEIAMSELTLHGRTVSTATISDGCALPFPSASVDGAHCSNVLEHCPTPLVLLDELVRVTRPGGAIYVSYTNWFSPWGGHETSPWHYFGGEWSARRFKRRTGSEAKNRFGRSLYRLDIADVLTWVKSRNDVRVVEIGPRYYPRLARFLVKVPGVREVVTWNLKMVLQRRD